MTVRALRLTGSSAMLVLAGTHASLAQTLGHGADPDISLWRIGASLVLCAGLAVGGAYILKMRSGRMPVFRLPMGRQRRLRVVEQLSLGRDTGISIVACDGREILVLTSSQGSRVIDTLPQAIDAPELSHERA